MPKVEDIISLVVGGATEEEKALITKAYNFAQKAHEGQQRLSGEPYFNHAFETAKTLAFLRMDTETIVAGLLHDTLEDTDLKEDELEKEFGKDIVALVKGVTKLGTLKYKGRERYVESLRKFFMAITDDLRVVVIKFADRLHNLKTLEYVREDKRKRIALESIEVYAPLANRLGMGKLKGELEDVAFPYAYPKEYATLEEILKNNKNTKAEQLNAIIAELEKELVKNKINVAEINYRMKHKYSLWKKLLKREMDLDKVYDIMALRVVVETVEECYRVLGIIHSIWRPLPGRIKDYISIPKPNGYKSIHTTIFTGEGDTAEIQIRTREMHAEAAYGIAAHFAYKESELRKVDDPTKFKWIEELKNFNKELSEPTNYIEHLKMDFFNDRIFVFTPEGDVIDLPEDSTPIDFAYAVHSDIGDHIASAKANNKIIQIYAPLKNRDIVEITTKENSHPTSKWLNYVKTNTAKKHIRSYLEKNTLLARLKSFRNS